MAHQRPRSNLDTNHDKQMEEDKQMDGAAIGGTGAITNLLSSNQ